MQHRLGLPVHTIGLSGGGAIALDIAGRHEVASSMLYDPFLSPGRRNRRYTHDHL